MAEEATKACAACGQVKSVDAFHKNARMKGGLRSSCKTCVLAINRASVLKHHEKRKAEKRAVYHAIKHDPNFKEKVRKNAESYRPTKVLRDQERHRNNAEEVRGRVKAWAKNNPDRRSAILRSYIGRRRSLTKNGVGGRQLADWTKLQPKVCYWCHAACGDGFHVDHYVPLSKGGAHELHNLVIACGPCNLKKNAKDPLDFAREIGLSVIPNGKKTEQIP